MPKKEVRGAKLCQLSSRVCLGPIRRRFGVPEHDGLPAEQTFFEAVNPRLYEYAVIVIITWFRTAELKNVLLHGVYSQP